MPTLPPPEEMAAVVAGVTETMLGLTFKPEPGGTPWSDDVYASSATGGRFVDIVVVDDMENVHKKLRSTPPAHVSMNAFTSAQAALGASREKVYRVVVVDTEIPDVNSAVLAQQIRVLQPHAAMVALTLRTSNDVSKEVREQGLDDVLFKPFRPEVVGDFLGRSFDNQDFPQVEDNVLKVAPLSGKADRIERFYTRLHGLYNAALEKVAAACYDEVVLDLGVPPPRATGWPSSCWRSPRCRPSSACRSRWWGRPRSRRSWAATPRPRT